VGRPVTHAHRGALIPEIVRRGFEDLLEAEVSAAIGATRHARFPYVYLDATYLHGRLGQNMQVVSRAVVVDSDQAHVPGQ
jgi:hypothetical protein